MNKKSQGLSINVIIIVAIALIVLVVLIAVFTGQMGDWINKVRGTGDPAKTCTAQDGVQKGACATEEIEIASSDATAKGKKCCMGA